MQLGFEFLKLKYGKRKDEQGWRNLSKKRVKDKELCLSFFCGRSLDRSFLSVVLHVRARF